MNVTELFQASLRRWTLARINVMEAALCSIMVDQYNFRRCESYIPENLWDDVLEFTHGLDRLQCFPASYSFTPAAERPAFTAADLKNASEADVTRLRELWRADGTSRALSELVKRVRGGSSPCTIGLLNTLFPESSDAAIKSLIADTDEPIASGSGTFHDDDDHADAADDRASIASSVPTIKTTADIAHSNVNNTTKTPANPSNPSNNVVPPTTATSTNDDKKSADAADDADAPANVDDTNVDADENVVPASQ